jgi:hypothetical protein
MMRYIHGTALFVCLVCAPLSVLLLWFSIRGSYTAGIGWATLALLCSVPGVYFNWLLLAERPRGP